MGRNRQNSHTRAQKQLRRQLLRLIESVCSASKAKWRLGNSRARETSEKRERGMMGASVERERGVMGSLCVQMLTVRTFILGTSLPIGCRRRLVFIERARKTRFSLLSRARPRHFSLFTRKRIGACNAAYFSTNINFLPTIFRHNQVERLPELIKWSPKWKCFDL